MSLVAISPRTPSLRKSDEFPVVASLPKERHARNIKYTTMERCFNLEDVQRRTGLNLLTCFYVDLYRDALCEIGNKMHNDYRYSQLSHSYVEEISGLGLESL